MMPFDEMFDLLGYCFRTNGEKYSGDGEDGEDGDGEGSGGIHTSGELGVCP